MPNDEDIQKQVEHDKIVQKFILCDYESFVSDLLNKEESKSPTYYIGIDKTDEYHVFLEIRYSYENYLTYDYTVDEFEDILTKLRDANIELYPYETENYPELTNKLIAKLRQ